MNKGARMKMEICIFDGEVSNGSITKEEIINLIKSNTRKF